MRKENDPTDGCSRDKPSGEQNFSRWRAQYPGDQAEEHEADAVLVHHAQPRCCPDDKPPSRVSALEHFHKEHKKKYPEEDVEDIHGKVIAGTDVKRRNDSGKGGSHPGLSLPSKPDGEDGGHDDHGGHNQRRQKAQSDQRISEQQPIEREKPDGERGLVNVAPGQTLRACDIVQLVTEDAVFGDSADETMEQKHEGGQCPYARIYFTKKTSHSDWFEP